MFQQYDLTELEPNVNIKIIGPPTPCGKTCLERNIMYILSAKNCTIEPYNGIGRFYISPNNQERFSIIVTCNKSDNANDLIFIHADYFKDNFVGNVNEEDFSTPYTFFVLHKGTIKKCIAENQFTYLDMYNKMPFCYDNITNLINIISNSYSIHHKMYGILYGKLQFRLKELDVIYCTIYCTRNSENNNIWLPNELNLEIIKLLFLNLNG
jgi:hypothetical protein